jgi:nitrate reductase alpha subunit
MGWLPSAPQLNLNPLTIKAKAEQAGDAAGVHRPGAEIG